MGQDEFPAGEQPGPTNGRSSIEELGWRLQITLPARSFPPMHTSAEVALRITLVASNSAVQVFLSFLQHCRTHL